MLTPLSTCTKCRLLVFLNICDCTKCKTRDKTTASGIYTNDFGLTFWLPLWPKPVLDRSKPAATTYVCWLENVHSWPVILEVWHRADRAPTICYVRPISGCGGMRQTLFLLYPDNVWSVVWPWQRPELTFQRLGRRRSTSWDKAVSQSGLMTPVQGSLHSFAQRVVFRVSLAGTESSDGKAKLHAHKCYFSPG